MDIKLKAKLQIKIEEWVAENCEDSEIWPFPVVGNETELQMTNAAAAVFDGIVEAQEYGERKGFFDS